MNPSDKRVLIVGGGIAGLSAALYLADLKVSVSLAERAGALGGHAKELVCKALDVCVHCGACLVDEKIERVLGHPGIEVFLGTDLVDVSKEAGKEADEPHLWTGYYSVTLKREGEKTVLETEAIILAQGFSTFDPVKKPYGYGLFEDVITNLSLEKMIGQTGELRKPSDKGMVKKMAFIQCVGSRDAGEGHPWCSKVCCASALRLSALIKQMEPDIEITIFYIDIQNPGSALNANYHQIPSDLRLIRSIPADIFKTGDDQLKMSYFDPVKGEGLDEDFDLVVLSVGLVPNKDAGILSSICGVELDDYGFIKADSDQGIFLAGTVSGPMDIAESVKSAGQAAFEAIEYFEKEYFEKEGRKKSL